MKRLFLFLITIGILLTSTACWNNRDLTELSIATAFGIDRTKDGKTMVSVQIVKPSEAQAGGKEGGGGSKKGFVVVSNTADTVFGALREMLSKVNNKIFYSSSQIIVIGEDAARDGIEDFLDFTLRDHETQFKQLVIVSKGVTAKEILEQEYDLSKVPGAYLRDTVNNIEARGFSKSMMLIEVARELATEGRELCMGTVQKKGTTTDISGIAVFLMDKLVGWLDPFESRGYMFVMGRVKSTLLEVDDPQKPDKQVGIEIQKTSSERKLEWTKNGKPSFTVKIKVQGNIGEQYGGHGAMKETEILKAVTESCNNKIKREALLAIRKCQAEYKSDILGFGMKVFDDTPNYWKSIRDKWNSDFFPNIEVNVEVESKILRSGLLDKPIEVQ
ncbi:MAG: Ger(x)C family spore germination protein [Clostridia bacterium]|nr:Ger(x)C family spore germination protein [Clostridia bacterium]